MSPQVEENSAALSIKHLELDNSPPLPNDAIRELVDLLDRPCEPPLRPDPKELLHLVDHGGQQEAV